MSAAKGGGAMSPPAQPIDVRCPACHAKSGVTCTTSGGRPTDPHTPRVELFKDTVREIQKWNAWEQTCQPKGTKP